MKPPLRSLALAACLLLPSPASASAGGPGVFAASRYWDGFVDFWAEQFQRQNGVVMGVIGVGAVALFIITRGKWRK